MDRHFVQSSNILSIGYDSENMVLEIEFNSRGIYQYFDVPNYEYEELMNSDSLGKYFHQNIKENYQWIQTG